MNDARRRQPTPAAQSAPRLAVGFFAVGLVLLLAWFGSGAPVAAQEVPELQINSKRYIVVDAGTGEIYAQRGAHDRAAMASLTKIFTAIEALETAPLSTEITTNPSDIPGPAASTMGFGPDETFTLEELLYGLMLPSGNDAAHAIARTLGAAPGDADEAAVDRFVARINERVRNMGLTETTLVNPSGWGVPGHFTSAHDLAAFTIYALRYPRFVDLISTKYYETSNGYPLTNNNRLLGRFDDIVGGKTGYDLDSGWCLVEIAERDGATMVSVTMDGVAPEDWYDDNRVLLDYAFEQKAVRLAAGGGVVGDVVGFRDPDAALIERLAQSTGSLGRPAPAALLPDAGLRGGAPAATGSNPTLVEDDRFVSRQALAAVAVAALVILGRGLLAFTDHRRLRPAAPFSAALSSRPAAPSIPARPARRPPLDPVSTSTSEARPPSV